VRPTPWLSSSFIKPGKGAAFTRTKFKNLLSGAVIERNIRSGEKLESANVETKTMQYLYKEADSFVFMDTSTYDQVQIPSETIGEDALLMPEQIVVEVLFFQRTRGGRDFAQFHRTEDPGDRARLPRRHGHGRGPSRPRYRPAPPSRCRFSSTKATPSRSTRAAASTWSGSVAA